MQWILKLVNNLVGLCSKRWLQVRFLRFYSFLDQFSGANRQHDEGAHHQTLFDDLWIVQQMLQHTTAVTYKFKGTVYIHWGNLSEALVRVFNVEVHC